MKTPHQADDVEGLAFLFAWRRGLGFVCLKMKSAVLKRTFGARVIVFVSLCDPYEDTLPHENSEHALRAKAKNCQ